MSSLVRTGTPCADAVSLLVMFEQSFLDDTRGTKKPFAVLLTIFLQVAGLAVLILVPLVYTQVLPNAQLRSVFAAPRSPQAPNHPRAVGRAESRPTVNVRPISVEPLREIFSRPKEQAEQIGAPPTLTVSGSEEGGELLSRELGSTLPTPAPQPFPAVAKSAPRQPIRVGSGPAEASLTHKVQPIYPSLAKQTRVQGVVEFTAVISKEGNIERLQLVRGHPMLVKAAEEAILQWKYRPTLLNGEPVEVITDIIVNFTLTQ